MQYRRSGRIAILEESGEIMDNGVYFERDVIMKYIIVVYFIVGFTSMFIHYILGQCTWFEWSVYWLLLTIINMLTYLKLKDKT